MNPRQNQISTVIHHQLQILRFLLLVPSDPLIAWGHLPSRRRPQQTGQYLLSTPPGAHQVAEICSYRHAVGQVVIPLDQLGPQPALAAALDHPRSEEHTSELQSQSNLVCRLLLEKNKTTHARRNTS